MLVLRLHPKSLQELRNFPPKHYKQVIGKLFSLLDNPLPNDSLQLKGTTEKLFRVTAGEYRIVYSFTETELFVEAIGARNDDKVYRDISKRF